MKRALLSAIAAVVALSAFAQTSRQVETIKLDQYSQWSSSCQVYTELVMDLDSGSRSGNLLLRVTGEQNYSDTNIIPRSEIEQVLKVLEYAQSNLISGKPANSLSATFKSSTACSVSASYLDEALRKGWSLVVQTDELDPRSMAFIKISDMGNFIKNVQDCKAKIDAFVAGK